MTAPFSSCRVLRRLRGWRQSVLFQSLFARGDQRVSLFISDSASAPVFHGRAKIPSRFLGSAYKLAQPSARNLKKAEMLIAEG
jgi:hypothetical protein